MKIVVTGNSEIPIYEQIKHQVLDAILNSELAPGDILPSMRGLAKELKVGVLTINRAYTDLENEGYIENIQGKGCFVAERSRDAIKNHLLDEAADKIMQAIADAQNAGISDSEIIELFNQCLRRTDNE